MSHSAVAAARLALGVCLAGALLAPVHAHKSSDAYLTWRITGATIEQRVDVALRDLDRDLELDANDDGALTWGEVRQRWSAIEQLVNDSVRVSADGHDCVAAASAAPQLDEHTDGRYAVLQRTLRCAAPVAALAVDYRLFARSDATHRGIARIVAGDERSAMLVPGASAQRFEVGARSGRAVTTFGGFVAEGAHHIAIGVDHVLFLLTLLMVAVWRRQGAGWVARTSAGSAWREALRLVTAFTVAHSLTLGLATFGVLAPPSRWIESIIAASVLAAAVDNLWPFVKGPRWIMVSVFGLAHGFGFAGPLQALGLERGQLALPLLGFNLGVELGQLAIVALALPLACALRAAPLYRVAVVRGGSALIAGVAALWMVQRSLDVSLWP